MKKIGVLGAGMVGSAMAIDLSKQHHTTVADLNEETLKSLSTKHGLHTAVLNVKDKEQLKKTIHDWDLVVCAVPGFLGFETVKTVIECGKNMVDISFMPEHTMELDALAKKNHATVICDCGVAPGMPNVIIGYYNTIMQITDVFYVVGGLPKVRKFPFEYKAPFSPVDVIEEYTRPARYVENGKLIVREPLSEPELMFFDKLGHLEAFNSDGLRSLINTMPHIPNMKEKTLRYQGHIHLIQALNSAGFFSKTPLSVKGMQVAPFDLTCKVLFDEWKLQPQEKELTIMRIMLKGMMNNKPKEIVYDLYDEYCEKTQTSSMARTTGYCATSAANLILKGLFNDKGVFPPELVGKDKTCFDFMLQYQKERGIDYVLKS